jgi:tRNA nucleotidyltransferase (CCA-adding enzyme)
MVQHSALQGFSPDQVVAKLPQPVQVYVVGGAVRDALMGREFSDRDWVVVGATVEDMLAAGFKPVGTDFPVFLHPHTHEEYALARTERKSGHGYKGFTFHADPTVTLEEDLARRDFTINAMAMDAQARLIDPYNGLADLQGKLMRHVSPAFVEDPLRVLRLARFLARFLDFSVAEDTMALCRNLRDSGELKHLVAERVYAEFNKGMGEEKPSRMIKLINTLECWSELAAGCAVPFAQFDKPEFDRLNGLQTAQDRWVYSLGFFLNAAEIKALAKAWRLPRDTEDLATLASNFLAFLQTNQFDSGSFGQFFNRVDLYRKPARLRHVNGLIQSLAGRSPVHNFVELAVDNLEAGHYKSFLATRISDLQVGQQVATVAAQARQDWLNNLYAEHF